MIGKEANQGPGTWRVSDGSAIAFALAKQAWTIAARDVLIRTARRYHGYITYGELAEEIQQALHSFSRASEPDPGGTDFIPRTAGRT